MIWRKRKKRVTDLQTAFDTSNEQEYGEKAHSMNLRCVFFRNLNVAAAYGAFLFFIGCDIQHDFSQVNH
jgi:hypothetical protein